MAVKIFDALKDETFSREDAFSEQKANSNL